MSEANLGHLKIIHFTSGCRIYSFACINYHFLCISCDFTTQLYTIWIHINKLYVRNHYHSGLFKESVYFSKKSQIRLK